MRHTIHQQLRHCCMLVGEDLVHEACKNLLADNVLSKLVRDPNKASPGRALKISEMQETVHMSKCLDSLTDVFDRNQAALGGQMAKELFVDATQLEEAYASGQEDEWHEWPLLSTDGDTAAILQMVSDHMVRLRVDFSNLSDWLLQVDVQFDTTNAQIARQTIDYASKKASK